MSRHLRPGTAELTLTKSVARARALKRRRRRNRLLFLSAILISAGVGMLLVRPAKAPQAEENTLFIQSTPTQPTRVAEVLPSTTPVQVEKTPTPTTEPTALPILPTQAQAITYSKDNPILYYAQSGDSLPVLAVHFGVEISDITSTSALPEEGFVPPGQLLLIPARLDSVSSPLKLFPDSEVVNSPSTIDFDVNTFVDAAGGYLSTYKEYLNTTGLTSGADIVKRVAKEYSINPRLLLAVLEYQSDWVFGTPQTATASNYPMGELDVNKKGLYHQLVWAAGEIATGYYGWREGTVVAITFSDGALLRLAPDLNSGSAGLMYFYAQSHVITEWAAILYDEYSVINLYHDMFGNPWLRAQNYEPLFTPAVTQPEMILPFETGKIWAFTGGPHAAWGAAEVRGALDFAPPSDESGCVPSSEWVVASAAGLVVRSENGAVVIDMDGDGFEQTGWNIIYLHIATEHRIPVDTWVEVGDRLGHPSCEGGRATGTHVHITRKFNGEWVPADGALPFVLSGWKAKAGSQIYTGWLIKDDRIIRANILSSSASHIQRED